MRVNEGSLPMPRLPAIILLVDDEPDILSSVKMIIESAIPGTTVLTANSGRVGLDLLSTERVDLVITDFKMPGMDGVEFLQRCRKMRPTVPRLMLTAFADDELIRRGIREAFVDEFIPKMASPDDFLDRVKRHLPDLPPGTWTEQGGARP